MIMSVSTLTIRKGAATPSSLSNFSMAGFSVALEWPLGVSGSSPGHRFLFPLEMMVVHHLGDLDVVHLVELGPAELLRHEVLGVLPPRGLALLMLELDDGAALAVVGPE